MNFHLHPIRPVFHSSIFLSNYCPLQIDASRYSAFVVGNLFEYRHKLGMLLLPKTRFFGLLSCHSVITQNNYKYAVKGTSRSPILIPTESSYATILHRFQLLQIIGQIFAVDRGMYLSLTHIRSGRISKLRMTKFDFKKEETYRSIVRCEIYFDILNRFWRRAQV